MWALSLKETTLRSFYRQRHYLSHLTLTLTFISLGFIDTAAQRQRMTDREGTDAQVAGITFSVPQGFKLEQSSDARVAFMRNPEISLFVAVPTKRVDEKYLIELSNGLASKLLSQQEHLVWKVQPAGVRKMSRYQTSRGSIMGLNEETYVQLDYVVLKIRGQEAVVGSIGTYGEGPAAAHFFNYGGSGYSFTGWSGCFHLISSITGEKL